MQIGMLHKVAGCKTHLVAVVAENLLHATCIFCLDALRRQQLAAKRAGVVVLSVRREADAVYEVAAREVLV